jgi:sulfate adenylyltransferase subunit 2
MKYTQTYLRTLEDEAIFIIREAVAQCERPVMLFSGGKDSICMVHLAKKAFAPGPIPFPLMHIDTGHNFEETLTYRDHYAEKMGVNLIVRTVQASIDAERVHEERGARASRNALQTVTLLDAINEFKFDAAFGGGRRDEEKARAKERFFSFRNSFGHWDPKNQRPELWNIFNARKNVGEHFRVFPLSNWTERDVWEYIKEEEIEMPSLYFSHSRRVYERDGAILADADFIEHLPGEKVEERIVRFRTIGDITCTGATESSARNYDDIIAEISATRVTERGSRSDDKRSEAAMEDRKKMGYF